jgi:regulator of sigma E protease
MDTEALKQPAQPWEYRSKPAWQRLFIMTGGVLVNFIAALVIYAMMLFAWGKEYLPLQNAAYGYDYCQTALNNGFENGDRILFVNSKQPETLGEALEEILLADQTTVAVLRRGDTVRIALPPDFSQQMLAADVRVFARERVPFVVESVTAGTPAHSANLQAGDSIVSLNGHSVPFIAQLTDTLLAYAEKPVTLGFYRNGELLKQEITPSASGKIGVVIRSPLSFFETKRQEYGFFAAIPAGVKLGTQTLVSYVRSFKIMFTKEGARSLGGFGTIGSLFTQVWSWAHFWSMTAFLSIIIAFMNILPIPALDGGHMVFIIYEMVTRRKPSDKFLERVQMVGLYLLIALMVYANGNDLVRWLSKFW